MEASRCHGRRHLLIPSWSPCSQVSAPYLAPLARLSDTQPESSYVDETLSRIPVPKGHLTRGSTVLTKIPRGGDRLAFPLYSTYLAYEVSQAMPYQHLQMAKVFTPA